MSPPRTLGRATNRLRNAPISDEEWAQLLESDDIDVAQAEGGEMLLVRRDGQLQLLFAFDDNAAQKRAFGPLFEALRDDIPEWGTDYVAAHLVSVSSRRWIDPLLAEADFLPHGEWIDMVHQAVTELSPPEIPAGLTMRRGTAADHDAIVVIEAAAYEQWSDGEDAIREHVESAGWVGVLTDGDRVIAYAVNTAAENGRGRTLSAAVEPDRQGDALGAIILGAAGYQLGASGALEAVVRVRPDIPAGPRTAANLGYEVDRRGREYRRPTDESVIEARREQLRVQGMKVRFGDWR